MPVYPTPKNYSEAEYSKMLTVIIVADVRQTVVDCFQ